MKIGIDKLKAIGCEEIKKEVFIEVDDKIAFDLVGYIKGEATVGVDISEGGSEKGVGILAKLSQVDQINYYGFFNLEREEWNWYQLIGGNISTLNKMPILQEVKESRIDEITKWIEEVLDRIYSIESFSILELFIELYKLVLIKLELDNGNLEAVDNRFTIDNIKDLYCELIRKDGNKFEGDIKLSSKALKEVVDEFNNIDFKNVDRVELMKILDSQLFENKSKAFGEYFLPQEISNSMRDIFEDYFEKISNIFDGVARSGRLLTDAKVINNDIKVFGMDNNHRLINLAELRSLILGQDNKFLVGDTLKLRSDKSQLEGLTDGLDLILSSPMFGLKIRDKDLLSEYELGQGRSTKIEALYLELYQSLLKEGGYLGIVLPDGILTNSRDKDIRGFILDKFILKAVISLPEGIYRPYTAINTSLVIVKNKGFEDEKQDEVFMATPENVEELKDVILELKRWGGIFGG
ncbi:type I restriction enzyme M protein [Orenia metallireducens]|uniref:Type I restriction enzyme M protein n=1 Tax=Orenia metallireducens TaxID=1413210 RepID=A0A285I5A0_9FIRM|nr:N-6 DNA methylase [Orenia metallireducens]PRX23252.1 type I restriction enzyme M protein [Orenia metallireducens]SNY42111.1 type I restriction enzyme M protein [Orenia metallireducens]